jgi:hypothetical protein
MTMRALASLAFVVSAACTAPVAVVDGDAVASSSNAAALESLAADDAAGIVQVNPDDSFASGNLTAIDDSGDALAPVDVVGCQGLAHIGSCEVLLGPVMLAADDPLLAGNDPGLSSQSVGLTLHTSSDLTPFLLPSSYTSCEAYNDALKATGQLLPYLMPCDRSVAVVRGEETAPVEYIAYAISRGGDYTYMAGLAPYGTTADFVKVSQPVAIWLLVNGHFTKSPTRVVPKNTIVPHDYELDIHGTTDDGATITFVKLIP